MNKLAEHARATEKAMQQAQLASFTAVREKDSAAAKHAEIELQMQLLRNQLDVAGDERRRAETARDRVQKERDGMLSELRKAEAELLVLKQQSLSTGAQSQQQTARMIAETTELRRRLAAAEAAREKERAQVQSAQAANLQMQSQLQMAREAAAREAAAQEHQKDLTQATHASQLQARIDEDNALAFNADLLAFASKMHLPPPPPRTRHTSPLRKLTQSNTPSSF